MLVKGVRVLGWLGTTRRGGGRWLAIAGGSRRHMVGSNEAGGRWLQGYWAH